MQTMLQMFFALMNKIPVVHVPTVCLYAQLLLDVVVELVWVHKRGHLRNLTAEPEPHLAEIVYKAVHEPHYARIGKRLADRRL